MTIGRWPRFFPNEIGMIAQTTHRVCGCLRETIDSVSLELSQQARTLNNLISRFRVR